MLAVCRFPSSALDASEASGSSDDVARALGAARLVGMGASVAELTESCGLTQAEAAARLGITQQAVSERLDTALYRPLEEVMGHAVALAAALEAREGSEARASNPRTSGTPTDGSRP